LVIVFGLPRVTHALLKVFHHQYAAQQIRPYLNLEPPPTICASLHVACQPRWSVILVKIGSDIALVQVWEFFSGCTLAREELKYYMAEVSYVYITPDAKNLTKYDMIVSVNTYQITVMNSCTVSQPMMS